jgi:hypothetical protein
MLLGAAVEARSQSCDSLLPSSGKTYQQAVDEAFAGYSVNPDADSRARAEAIMARNLFDSLCQLDEENGTFEAHVFMREEEKRLDRIAAAWEKRKKKN